jgi:Mg2+ and Co2+ transporter CorA
MKKYVSSVEMADEMGRIIECTDICLYLNTLHRNYGKTLRDERSMCSAESVSDYISDRLYDLLDDLRTLVDDCEIVENVEDELKLKVS